MKIVIKCIHSSPIVLIIREGGGVAEGGGGAVGGGGGGGGKMGRVGWGSLPRGWRGGRIRSQSLHTVYI